MPAETVQTLGMMWEKDGINAMPGETVQTGQTMMLRVLLRITDGRANETAQAIPGMGPSC